MSIDKDNGYLYATAAAVAVLLIAVLVMAVIKKRQELYGPLDTGLCPVEVILPLPRDGVIRYHAELSCEVLDKMAREQSHE